MDKTHNPQDDVFLIINGKPKRVVPYDLSERETKQEIKSIPFDGNYLTTIAQDKNGVKITQRLPAVSGKPQNGFFDYSPQRQQEKDQGPVPEGEYIINPQKIDRPTPLDKIIGVVGSGWLFGKKFGAYPGGEFAWGNCRTNINQTPKQKEESGRSGFFIHGGTTPGSKGCIDLLDKDVEFCNFIEKYRGKNQKAAPLIVKYKK